jgi:hypothetical protein
MEKRRREPLRWLHLKAYEVHGYKQGHPSLSRSWSIALLVVLIVLAGVYLAFLDPLSPSDRWLLQWDTGRFLLDWLGRWGASQFILDHIAALLGLLPSILAFGYYALSRQRETPIRKSGVLRYLKFQHSIIEPAAKAHPYYLEMDIGDAQKDEAEERAWEAHLEREFQNLRPRPLQFFFGAVLMGVLFLALAALSDYVLHNRGELTGVPISEKEGIRMAEGMRGMVFTGYGVFTHTLVALIHRIHSAALSSEFLMGATLRGTLTMVIGFAMGLTGVFQAEAQRTSELGILLYFVVGAFPSWGYEALRRKARELLKPDNLRTSSLSLALVDGLDEPVIDRLEELGISNVQNLATTNPVELCIKTLQPFFRIVDWIDQAILITALREKICAARELSIRRASDLRSVYLESLPEGIPFPKRQQLDGAEAEVIPMAHTHAQKALLKLARHLQLDPSILDAVCRGLQRNLSVQVFQALWQLQEEERPEGQPPLVQPRDVLRPSAHAH